MPDIDDFSVRRTTPRRAAVCSVILASLGAIVLAGCAQSSAPEPISSAQAAVRQADGPICHRGSPAAQVAPDCAFHRAELKTIDPDQWARLKIEYERQCYQRAEQTARERLNRLLVENRCEG